MKKQNTIRAAIYARYSTKKQDEASIEDQVRECRRICERESFKIVATFSDAAISGGTTRRPGYQGLLAAARQREFDVIVSEDSSRLWRELAEQWRALKELADLGIAVVGNGIDTRREESAILLSVTGAANEAYRYEISRRTRRGQEGQARKAAIVGGRAFGYAVENGRKVIVPREAKIVRRIFEMRAAGHSPLAIARTLNAEEVAPPGAAWQRTGGVTPVWRVSAISGDPKRGIGILNNELYRGRLIWGRTKWVRSATDSSKRKPVQVPKSEWIVHQLPHLRIVDEALWGAVQRVQTADTPLRAAIRKGIRMSPNKGKGNYWLSGILVCEGCGSNLQVNNSVSYRCPNFQSGKCRNDRLIKRADIEEEMLEILKDELLRPERVKSEQRCIEAKLKEQERQERHRGEIGDGLRRINAQMASLRNLGMSEAATRAALAELEREREALQSGNGHRNVRIQEAKRMLARLPKLAAEFKRQLEETLRGRTVDKHGMRVITDATRDLIAGGNIRLRPCKGGVTGQVELLGLGSRVLHLNGTARGARVSGSGGRI